MLATMLMTWMVLGAPEISGVEPSPLPRLATAEVVGAGFASGLTSVTIGEVSQQVLFAEAGRARFLVSVDTPLGEQTLTVTVGGAGGGVANTAVTVVAPAPKITAVAPDRLELGALATVTGTDLDAVTGVTLDGVACAVTEQTAFVLVFEIPFESELLGNTTLVLSSPSGDVSRTVDIGAPPPVIDALVPNPVRAGHLLTVRGRILPLPVKVTVGGRELPIVSAVEGEVVALVPRDLAPGPLMVLLQVGALTSEPAGPLNVQAPDADPPVIEAVYPGKVAAGGEVVVTGEHLGSLSEVGGGLELIACGKRVCRFGTGGLSPRAPFKVVAEGPRGAALFELEIVDEAPVVPVAAEASPLPAFRGQALVVTGTRLDTVRSVVLGGVAQSIGLVDAGRVELVIAAMTPLGAEELFVVGNSASAPLTVTVLDPLPVEPGPEAEPQPEEVEAEPTPDEAEAERPPKKDDGCGGGPVGAGLGLVALAGLALARVRTRLLRGRSPAA